MRDENKSDRDANILHRQHHRPATQTRHRNLDHLTDKTEMLGDRLTDS